MAIVKFVSSNCPMNNIFSYAMKAEKTDGGTLVSGINCICNFHKYCSDACCKSAEQKRTEERKSAHHSEHICKVCGKSFSSKRTDAQYCSNKCRQKSYRVEKR